MKDLIYLYSLIPETEANARSIGELKDFGGKDNLRIVPIQDTAAIVCTLDGDEYSEELIKDKTSNDMEWLQEKAFHHHETVLALAKQFTVIPLKFCTLYKSEESLISSIEPNADKLADTFKSISGKEEWNLKIYCDDKALKKQFSDNNPALAEKMLEISELPKGKQFFEKRKIDKWIDGEIEKEKDQVSEGIHEKLCGHTCSGHVKKTWGKDATGRNDPMTWNSVYLVDKSGVDAFLNKIEELQKEMETAGWQLEASGPWPVYHFSSIS